MTTIARCAAFALTCALCCFFPLASWGAEPELSASDTDAPEVADDPTSSDDLTAAAGSETRRIENWRFYDGTDKLPDVALEGLAGESGTFAGTYGKKHVVVIVGGTDAVTAAVVDEAHNLLSSKAYDGITFLVFDGDSDRSAFKNAYDEYASSRIKLFSPKADSATDYDEWGWDCYDDLVADPSFFLHSPLVYAVESGGIVAVSDGALNLRMFLTNAFGLEDLDYKPVDLSVDATYDQTEARKLLALVNKERASKGASALNWDSALEETCMLRAAEIGIRYGHSRPSGMLYSAALPAYDKDSSQQACGENLAMGRDTAKEQNQAWIDSQDHHENMINEEFNCMAAACYIAPDGTRFWVELFMSDEGSGMQGAARDGSIETTVSALKQYVNLHVLDHADGESGFSNNSEPSIKVGGTVQLYSFAGDTRMAKGTCTWKSADTRVATVDKTGLVKGVSPGETTIHVALAGRSDISTDVMLKVEKTSTKPQIVRLAGSNAFGTMTQIVNTAGFGKGGTVVLVTFDGYWDALTAAGIAGLADAPIVMTSPNELTSDAKNLITKLQPKKIIVCGGASSVSQSVAKAACDVAGGAKLVRLAGSNATATADEIFSKGASETGAKWGTAAFVATNTGYWDALAAAPVSFSKHMPIFLTSGSDSLTDATLAAMKKGGIKQVYIVGGTSSVSKKVESQLKGARIEVKQRFAGDNAAETSQLLAQFGISSFGLSANNMAVATINGYWDALTGAALSGRNKSVLLLANDFATLPLADFAWANHQNIDRVYIYGGASAISNDVADILRENLE